MTLPRIAKGLPELIHRPLSRLLCGSQPGVLTGLLIGLLVAAPALSQTGSPAVTYRPHDAQAPVVTVGGSIRGSAGDLALSVLAPPTLAATATPTPDVFWHASNTVTWPVELVLVEENGEQPLFEQTLQPPLQAGIHRFTLPPEITLTEGRVYQFSIAAVVDPDIRSSDVFASALLTYRNLPLAVQDSSQTNPLRKAAAQAAAGAWYDTLSTLADAQTSPQGGSTSTASLAQAQWQALLSNAGLAHAAEAGPIHSSADGD